MKYPQEASAKEIQGSPMVDARDPKRPDWSMTLWNQDFVLLSGRLEMRIPIVYVDSLDPDDIAAAIAWVCELKSLAESLAGNCP